MFENSVNIQGQQQIALATSAAKLLAPGVYDVWAATDVYVRVHTDATIANTSVSSVGYLIRSGQTVPVQIPSESYLGVSATATCMKVG